LKLLLRLSALIDALNQIIGHAVYWLVLAAVLVSAGNATVRYTLNESSNLWLELQWYLFAAIFLLCAGYTLLRNEHIRIDIITGRFSKRVQTWIDILGGLIFLLPVTLIIMWLSWPVFLDSYVRHETSVNAPILLRWPVKILIPIGFFLLALQGVSEIIKRIAFLKGMAPDPAARQRAHGEDPEAHIHPGD
jgi:TRAP-type mannitol/chloroaromatic compound transport system permease small subunit